MDIPPYAPDHLNGDHVHFQLRRNNRIEGYSDIPGLCKVATIKEIEDQGWSLNSGRYVGVADREDDGFDFKTRLEELNEELEILNADARVLEDRIAEIVTSILQVS